MSRCARRFHVLIAGTLLVLAACGGGGGGGGGGEALDATDDSGGSGAAAPADEGTGAGSGPSGDTPAGDQAPAPEPQGGGSLEAVDEQPTSTTCNQVTEAGGGPAIDCDPLAERIRLVRFDGTLAIFVEGGLPSGARLGWNFIFSGETTEGPVDGQLSCDAGTQMCQGGINLAGRAADVVPSVEPIAAEGGEVHPLVYCPVERQAILVDFERALAEAETTSFVAFTVRVELGSDAVYDTINVRYEGDPAEMVVYPTSILGENCE